MRKLIALGIITSALIVPALACAANTADLKLIGTITPTACVPNFTGGSTIDYGKIPAGTLNPDAPTSLPSKATALTVTCDAPAKFGVSVTDARAASLDASVWYPGLSQHYFGLGTAENGTKIGAFQIGVKNIIADTGIANLMYSSNGGATWANSGNNSNFLAKDRIVAFGNSAVAIVPSAHKTIKMDMYVVTAVVKSSSLPIANEINIDGLATFEVKYL